MKKFIVQNVMKVIDIHTSQFSPDTLNYLCNFFVTYKDMVLKEDLLNILDAHDDCFDETPPIQAMAPKKWYTEELKSEIAELKRLADKNDAAYIRITS